MKVSVSHDNEGVGESEREWERERERERECLQERWGLALVPALVTYPPSPPPKVQSEITSRTTTTAKKQQRKPKESALRLFFIQTLCTYGCRMFIQKFSVIRSDISHNLCTLYSVQLQDFLHQLKIFVLIIFSISLECVPIRYHPNLLHMKTCSQECRGFCGPQQRGSSRFQWTLLKMHLLS